MKKLNGFQIVFILFASILLTYCTGGTEKTSKVDDTNQTKIEGVYSGGDNVNLDIAITAIAHGRKAAAAIHAGVTHQELDNSKKKPLITFEKMF